MKKILFATSEAHPLIKTGGLADVAGSLPKAFADIGHEIRLILPAYQALKLEEKPRYISTVRVDNREVNILETQLPNSNVVVWLVDYRPFFDHPGNPYVDEHGIPWPNIADRFALFCRIINEVALDRAYLDWRPDIVHCNDWQTGLAPALMSLEEAAPATVFTIHNLAYQGLFPASTFHHLNLPGQLWHHDGLEYHGMLSFIKGGLAFSDILTTVSPTYAQEIQTPEFGYGLEGLLSHRHEDLHGILNGIDMDDWNPETDPLIPSHYSPYKLKNKLGNKIQLQQQMGLPENEDRPVFGMVCRLVEQKGIDLVLSCLAEMVELPLQFVLLGSGDKSVEYQLQEFARLYPEKISITIGYNEPLSHLIEAGSDVFLMPSRFEPCGLNQMYSQRYGTLPVVRKTGGLADTIEDALPNSLKNETATGIAFQHAESDALLEAIKRTLILFDNKPLWRKMQRSAMKKDFSWQNSARQYLALYETL